MEYSRKDIANEINKRGYITMKGNFFTDGNVAYILKKLRINSQYTKLVTYKDRRTGNECETYKQIYDERSKDKILNYVAKKYSRKADKIPEQLKLKETNSNDQVNKHEYYKGAYDSLKAMYNELTIKYNNLYSSYSKLLEENKTNNKQIEKKPFWKRG